MNSKREEMPAVRVESMIHTIRAQKVILDWDLAAIYGVETKNLNKAVSRNRDRFPQDFMFRLNKDEFVSLRFQIGTSKKGKGGRRYSPYAFTEHGAIMAANVLNSPKAVQMSVFVVRAFVKMREQLTATHILEKRLAEIEKTLLTHDGALRDLYDKIRPLLLPPPEKPKKGIGFQVKERRARYGTSARKKRKEVRHGG